MSKKKFKASVLIITMIILGIMLVSSLSISLVSTRERKVAIGDFQSGQAFQNAQSGVELVVQDIKSGKTFASQLSNCNSGTKLIEDTAISYTVELQDMQGVRIDCNSASAIANIAYLKSIGSFRDTQRSIRATVPLP